MQREKFEQGFINRRQGCGIRLGKCITLGKRVCLWRIWQHLALVGGGVFPPLCLPTATLIWFFFFWRTGDYGRGLTQGVQAGGKWDANRAVFCFMMDHPPAAETVSERARELAALWARWLKNTQITLDIKRCVRFYDAWTYEGYGRWLSDLRNRWEMDGWSLDHTQTLHVD